MEGLLVWCGVLGWKWCESKACTCSAGRAKSAESLGWWAHSQCHLQCMLPQSPSVCNLSFFWLSFAVGGFRKSEVSHLSFPFCLLRLHQHLCFGILECAAYSEASLNSPCLFCSIMIAALRFLLGYDQAADDEVEEASSSDDEADMSKPTSTSALSREAVYKVTCFSLCSNQVVHVLFVATPERSRWFGCPGLVGPFVFVPLNLAVNIVIFYEFAVQQRFLDDL